MKSIKKEWFKYEDIELFLNVDAMNKTIWFSQDDLSLIFHKSKSTIHYEIQKLKTVVEINKNSKNPTKNTMENSKISVCIQKLKIGENGRPVTCYNLDVALALNTHFKSKIEGVLQEFLNDVLLLNVVDNNKVIKYEDNNVSIDVQVSDEQETVWLSEKQISELYESTKQNVNLHIKNIFEEGELPGATVKKNFTVQIEGKRYIKRITTLYNLDVILAVGYRIKTAKAIKFRNWASKVLTKHLFQIRSETKQTTYEVIEKIVNIERRVSKIEEDIKDIEEKTFIEPIKERMFINGEYFDAYEYLCSIVSQAKEEIIIVDPYLDTKGLKILEKCLNISLTVVVSSKAKLNEVDIEAFIKQYGDLEVIRTEIFHDRYIILDKQTCYHVGASINYFGKKIFSMQICEDLLITNCLLKQINACRSSEIFQKIYKNVYYLT